MNKRHWISVDFHGDVPDAIHRELILHSYRQTAMKLPRNVREQLSIT